MFIGRGNQFRCALVCCNLLVKKNSPLWLLLWSCHNKFVCCSYHIPNNLLTCLWNAPSNNALVNMSAHIYILPHTLSTHLVILVIHWSYPFHASCHHGNLLISYPFHASCHLGNLLISYPFHASCHLGNLLIIPFPCVLSSW